MSNKTFIKRISLASNHWGENTTYHPYCPVFCSNLCNLSYLDVILNLIYFVCVTSPNLTIQCMNAYIQGSAGFTCAKPNHTNFKSAHCPLWTTCSLCSSSDQICALWFPHRSNSKSQNLCGKLIQPSLWRSSLVIDTHSSSQWKSTYGGT